MSPGSSSRGVLTEYVVTMTEMIRDAVIVDVDGTLCDVRGIRHYVLADQLRRNFDAFHKASALCPPIPETLDWVQGHRDAGNAIIIVTARKRQWEYLTRRWLRKWDICHDLLLMRADDDNRHDDLVKADILSSLRGRGFRIVAAIDDNPAIVALWEREGIPVTVVPGWFVPDKDAVTNMVPE